MLLLEQLENQPNSPSCWDQTNVGSGSLYNEINACGLNQIDSSGWKFMSECFPKSVKHALLSTLLIVPVAGYAYSPPPSGPTNTNYINRDTVQKEHQKIESTEQLSKINFIENTLELPINNIAQILRITRPAYYAWKRGRPLRPANEKRLQAIYELSNYWGRIQAPVKFKSILYITTENGNLLVDALCDEILSLNEITSTIDNYLSRYTSAQSNFNKDFGI